MSANYRRCLNWGWHPCWSDWLKLWAPFSLYLQTRPGDNKILDIYRRIIITRWIEVTTRMGEVVRMFNGGTGEWCLASQEERQVEEVGIK